MKRDDPTPRERFALELIAAHQECEADDRRHRQVIHDRVAYLDRTGWFDAWAVWCERQRLETT